MGDFIASVENKFTELVKFCDDKTLCLYDVNMLGWDTFAYEHVCRGVRSWIDHVAVNFRLLRGMEDCDVLDDSVLSDDFPLFVNVRVLTLTSILNSVIRLV